MINMAQSLNWEQEMWKHRTTHTGFSQPGVTQGISMPAGYNQGGLRQPGLPNYAPQLFTQQSQGDFIPQHQGGGFIYPPAGYVPQAPEYDGDQLINLLEKMGVEIRPTPRPAYSKPYPDWIDKLNPFPRNFKLPELTLFSGEDETQSTLEHVAKFLSQCGESCEYAQMLFMNGNGHNCFSGD